MHRLNKTLVYFLIFTVVSSALAYRIIVKAYDEPEYNYDFPEYKIEKSDHANLIKVSTPKLNGLVKSPLIIKGTARGTWYFEASFPVRLFDANGRELAVAPAQAQGEWMTEDFVPFEATLKFEKPATATGILVLQKDNPSGEASLDDSISIPVRF